MTRDLYEVSLKGLDRMSRSALRQDGFANTRIACTPKRSVCDNKPSLKLLAIEKPFPSPRKSLSTDVAMFPSVIDG